MAKRVNYTFGQQIGVLRFLCLSGIHTSPKGYQKRKCLVICDDGHISEKFLQDFSCKISGCFNCSYEKDLRCATTHGMQDSRMYACWQNMKERCNNKLNTAYENYGGRGIKICEDWQFSFENFYRDMIEGYNDNLTLDRIDVNGAYCKENCRWASNSMQAYNRRKQKNSRTERTGVTFNQNGKWMARISVENKEIYLGQFLSFQQAVEAREAAELKYFGFIKE